MDLQVWDKASNGTFIVSNGHLISFILNLETRDSFENTVFDLLMSGF